MSLLQAPIRGVGKKRQPRFAHPATGKRRTGTDLRKKTLTENCQRQKWLQHVWARENARYAGRWVAIENPHTQVREEGVWLAIGLMDDMSRLKVSTTIKKKRHELQRWSRVLMVAEVGEDFVVSWNGWDEEMRHDFLQMFFDPSLSASRPDMLAFISDRTMSYSSCDDVDEDETFVSAIIPWGSKHHLPLGPQRLVFLDTLSPQPTLSPSPSPPSPLHSDPLPLLPLEIEILNQSRLCPECGDCLLHTLSVIGDFCASVEHRWHCISCDYICVSSVSSSSSDYPFTLLNGKE